MSSALNHVPRRSGVSLTATHLFSRRPWQKNHRNNLLLATCRTKLPGNAFLGHLSSFRFLTSASSNVASEIETNCSRHSEVNESGRPRSNRLIRSRINIPLKFHSPSKSNETSIKDLENGSSQAANESNGITDGDVTHYAEAKKPSHSSKSRRKSKTPSLYLKHVLQGYEPSKKKPRMALQAILADYILFVEPLMDTCERGSSFALNDAMRRVFDEKRLEYLRTRHYDVADVVIWAWILRSKTVYKAMLRIFAVQQNFNTKHGVPPFIPLLLLHDENLDAKTFRLLLTYCLRLLSGQSLPTLHSTIETAPKDAELDVPGTSDNAPLIEPAMCTKFVFRMLHHARQVWPQAQLPIARAFAHYLTLPVVKERKSVREIRAIIATHRMNRFRATKFNTCLWLLSLPSKVGPYISASVQQQAQFELLKAMAADQPVIPVTRIGYQGIIAVQLAHKKTSAERQTAELKAPSWPPWKEEKLGIDSYRGIEGIKSRAMRVMDQMKEAGYPHTQWEEVCSILAGWDTDQSPTVQTRTLVSGPQSLQGPRGSKPYHQAIWVARIRATRTVREAWACFLSYQDQGLPQRAGIYAAMAEKLIFRKKAVQSHFDKMSQALPGDGPEVYPEPSSARDLIYVATEPPTLDELLEQMLAQGIRPSGRFLALLLREAPSFSSGLEYLRCSNLSDDTIQALCTVWGQQSDYDLHTRKALTKLPEHLLSAFVGFLCKFPNFNSLYLARHDVRAADLFPVIMAGRHVTQSRTSLFTYTKSAETVDELHHPKTLSHAVQVMKLWNSQYPLPWTYLLRALNTDRISMKHPTLSRSVQVILAWQEILEVVGWMKERNVRRGFQVLQILLSSFSKVVVAGRRNRDAAEEGVVLAREAARRSGSSHSYACSTFDEMVQTGLRMLKSDFDELVRPDAMSSHLAEWIESTGAPVDVPPMLHVPSPAHLHAFVRALGLAGDQAGILSLLRWMGQSASTLKDASDEYLNGEKWTRRTVVAVRVFMEGHLGKSSLDLSRASFLNDAGELVFADPNVQEAYDIVTSTGLWGSWPSDEEVWDYVHH